MALLDKFTNIEQRYSLGFDDKRETHYLSIPVSNAMVDYEEFYAIEKAEFDVFISDPLAASVFANRARCRELDERLIFQPGSDRGRPR